MDMGDRFADSDLHTHSTTVLELTRDVQLHVPVPRACRLGRGRPVLLRRVPGSIKGNKSPTTLKPNTVLNQIFVLSDGGGRALACKTDKTTSPLHPTQFLSTVPLTCLFRPNDGPMVPLWVLLLLLIR